MQPSLIICRIYFAIYTIGFVILNAFQLSLFVRTHTKKKQFSRSNNDLVLHHMQLSIIIHILCDIWKSVWDHNNADNKMNIHHVCKFTLVASIWWNTHNVLRKNVFLLCMCICSSAVYWDRTIILPVNLVQNSCNLVNCNQF